MRGKVFLYSVILLCVLCFCDTEVIIASSKSDKKFEYSLEEQSAFTYEDVQEVVDEVEQMEMQVDIEENMDDVNFDVDEVDTNGGYVEYLLADLPITLYEEGVSFSDMLSDDYRLKIPYVTEQEENAVLVYETDVTDNLILQEKILIYDNKHLYVAPNVVDEIIGKKINENVEAVTYCYSERYYMTLIYVKTVSNEYLIPFAKENTLNVKNGEVYTIEEFFSNMQALFDETQVIGSKKNGGLPYKDYSLWTYVIPLFVSCGGAIITSVYLVRLRKRC